MGMSDYAARLRAYFHCSDACFLVALIYVDRIAKRHPYIQVCNASCHRLFVIALVMASKYYEDRYFSNAYYAKVGGVSVREINKLERCFLQLLDWQLSVQPEEYSVYSDLLTAAIDSWKSN